MSDMFVTYAIDEQKMIADARKKSKKNRFDNPDGDGVAIHYHSADTPCTDMRHRIFLDGTEVYDFDGSRCHIEL